MPLSRIRGILNAAWGKRSEGAGFQRKYTINVDASNH
jgi:hypothetical protein